MFGPLRERKKLELEDEYLDGWTDDVKCGAAFLQ
jgi:hypothetical protein